MYSTAHFQKIVAVRIFKSSNATIEYLSDICKVVSTI